MSSYSGENTASDQQMKRRAQKQKQRVGSKKGFKDRQSDVSSFKLPKVVNATFSGETEAAIQSKIMDRPDLPVTTKTVKKWLKAGVTFKVTDDRFPTMDGSEFTVDLEGIHTPLYVHTVRIWTGMGFGMEIKRLPNGKVIVE